MTWPQTYHDAGHTGDNSSETRLKATNVSKLQLAWAASLAGPVTGFALDSGMIYAQSEGASQSAALTALNAQTGAQTWSVTTGNDGNALNGTVSTGGGFVYVGCSADLTSGEQGICAYSESSGTPVWSFFHNCSCVPPASVTSPPVYSNGTLYFGFSAGGGAQGALTAVNAATGTQLWQVSFTASQSLGSGAPVVGGGNVYVGCGTSVCAFDQVTGTPIWQSSVGGPHPALTTMNGAVYATTPFNGTNSTIVALNGTTGTPFWTFAYLPKPGFTNRPNQPAAIFENDVYVTGTNGVLYDMSRSRGNALWHFGLKSTGAGAASAPSVAGNIVYVNGANPSGAQANTTAHNFKNGTLLWSSPSTRGATNPPPIVANGILYFGSPQDGVCESLCAYSLPPKSR